MLKHKPSAAKTSIIPLVLFSWLFVAVVTAEPLPYVTLRKGAQVIHIQGTRHKGVSFDSLPEHEKVLADIRKSDFVYTEVNGIEFLDLFSALQFFSIQRLSDQLDPELYASLRDHLSKQFGYDPGFFFDHFSRMGICAFLSSGKEKAEDGRLDDEIREKARQFGVPGGALDSSWGKFRAFRAVADISEKECTSEGIAQLIRGGSQRGAFQSKVSESSFLGQLRMMKDLYPDAITPLLVDRNAAWLSQLLKNSAPAIFVAVGALHLYGLEGIVYQLMVNDFVPDDAEQVARMWEPLPIPTGVIENTNPRFASCREDAAVEPLLREGRLVGKYNCALYDCSVAREKPDKATCLYLFR